MRGREGERERLRERGGGGGEREGGRKRERMRERSEVLEKEHRKERKSQRWTRKTSPRKQEICTGIWEQKKKKKKKKKEWVSLCWSGCCVPSIHKRCPTTDRCGDFCLLRVPPWAGTSLIINLEEQGSPHATMLTPSLVWTPDRHSPTGSRNPDLKLFATPSPVSRNGYR